MNFDSEIVVENEAELLLGQTIDDPVHKISALLSGSCQAIKR
jgi:hypothetical protein